MMVTAQAEVRRLRLIWSARAQASLVWCSYPPKPGRSDSARVESSGAPEPSPVASSAQPELPSLAMLGPERPLGERGGRRRGRGGRANEAPASPQLLPFAERRAGWRSLRRRRPRRVSSV